MQLDVVRSNLKKLDVTTDPIEFLFQFLQALGLPKATITKLQIDAQNKTDDYVLLRRKIFFKPTPKDDLHAEFNILKKQNGISGIQARFVMIANDNFIYVFDQDTEEVLSAERREIYNYYDFFLPLIGIERTASDINDTADLKAAEKLAELYNLLIEENYSRDNYKDHINSALSRILFCCYASSIGLIERDILINIINRESDPDGSNLNVVLDKLFFLFSTEDRVDISNDFKELPHLSISLFHHNLISPIFNGRARRLLIEICSINWSTLNPDILGSLIQSIVVPDDSSGLSNCYTSASNIMKAIHPLFLEEMYTDYNKSSGNLVGLKNLLNRLKSICIFDPSCGAGNFLIIALKELRKLERLIKIAINNIEGQCVSLTSDISLNQFYGIDSNQFKVQLAQIGMWVADIQSQHCNLDMGNCIDSFDDFQISLSNPLRCDWSELVNQEMEVYIVCSPTFRGRRRQSPQQKKDVEFVFRDFKHCKNLDYATCWLYLASKFIGESKNKAVFVVTNSITQGEHIALLWPKIHNCGIEIAFAHTSFKWKNDASGGSGGVTVVIVGLQAISSQHKQLYTKTTVTQCTSITPYLYPGEFICVEKRTSPLSDLPPMPKGNMAYGEGLILNNIEKEALLSDYPSSSSFIKRLLGSQEFINGEDRWCLWITDSQLEEAMAIPPIRKRVEEVKQFRENSSASRSLKERPHQFRETNTTSNLSVIIPSVSSEKRPYVPIGFVTNETIVSNLAFVIYDCEPWIFGLLTSKIHLLWIRVVCGRLEERNRYSSRLGYNTFPFPKINEDKKSVIEECVHRVVAARELRCGETMAQMYSKDTMPKELIEAHGLLDLTIENCYREDSFLSDQERVEFLFDLYRKMVD